MSTDAPASDTQKAAAAPALAGDWTGSIEADGTTVRVVVHLTHDHRVTFDRPDQGAVGLVCSDVDARRDGLSFSLPAAHAKYRGTLEDETLVGTWTQGSTSLPLSLTRSAMSAGPNRPQNPKAPFPYPVEDVRFASAALGVTLAGTLTHPKGAAKAPAVVLITGSGPQDRDETLMGHKPFWVLADALTRAGVAVLRVDDRGFGESTGDFSTVTTADFARDTRGAVSYLAGRDDIDPARIGLLGHSEGGFIAPMVAGEGGVSAVVLFAGPGVTGRQVIEGQVFALAVASGMDPADADAARAQQHALMGRVLDGATAAELTTELAALGMPDAQAKARAAVITSPWYTAFLRSDPTPFLQALQVPILALIGDRDLQVVAVENAPALRLALADNPKATVQTLPGLNHLFQPAHTGMPDEYATIETTIDRSVLTLVTDWLTENL